MHQRRLDGRSRVRLRLDKKMMKIMCVLNKRRTSKSLARQSRVPATVPASWGSLGASWGRPGGVLGASWGRLGLVLGVLGRLGSVCGGGPLKIRFSFRNSPLLGGRPGASWAVLGGVLGASWARLGVVLGRLRTSWGLLCETLDALCCFHWFVFLCLPTGAPTLHIAIQMDSAAISVECVMV